MISKELLSEVLNITAACDDISNIKLTANTITFIDDYWDEDEGSGFYRSHSINIYELAHKNLKQWAKLKNVFDIIDWSEEPEQIFKKVEKIRNEIN